VNSPDPILKRCDNSIKVQRGTPALVLAPMEGVTDAPMRACLTERGGFALCVSEFLRISQQVPPGRVFLKHVPELKHSSRTPSGTPVQIQLLGGDPDRLAASAERACALGAPAIDLNFGCPAPTVNRHDGGATLLKYPDRIYAIVSAVRAAVPFKIPVSAKLRLGWEDATAIHENADRAAEAGADWITIHGRTRLQGYAPPADWKTIGQVQRRLSIPVVANGDLWSREDFLRCRDVTGCEHFMLGRGAVANPFLALEISSLMGTTSPFSPRSLDLSDWLGFLSRFSFFAGDREPGHLPKRMKQWLKFAHLYGGFSLFDDIKRIETAEGIFAYLTARSLSLRLWKRKSRVKVPPYEILHLVFWSPTWIVRRTDFFFALALTVLSLSTASLMRLSGLSASMGGGSSFPLCGATKDPPKIISGPR
jgi:tRNA-dihydrouridine synthase C